MANGSSNDRTDLNRVSSKTDQPEPEKGAAQARPETSSDNQASYAAKSQRRASQGPAASKSSDSPSEPRSARTKATPPPVPNPNKHSQAAEQGVASDLATSKTTKKRPSVKPPALPATPKKAARPRKTVKGPRIDRGTDVEDPGVSQIVRGHLRKSLPGALVSFFFHILMILALAFWFLPGMNEEVLSLTSGEPVEDGLTDSTFDLTMEVPESEEITTEVPEAKLPNPLVGVALAEPTADEANQTSLNDMTPTGMIGPQVAQPSGLPVGGGIEGRTPEQRKEIGRKRGATAESEAAVEAGLAWLAAHQRPNGSWFFDHNDGPCDGKCSHAGTNGCSTAATGLAVLAFLGAGYTSEEGPYQKTVRDGIYYLISRSRINQFGADLREGTMYGQGIATLALCEAYAMTGDEAIKPIAQKGLDFIVSAQHKAGGWRYNPGQPGDTTVFGWQFMALKSAKLSKLHVPTPTIHLASAYLDSVQTNNGAFYGYLSPGKEPTSTAIGLLSRMYLGWRRQNTSLAQGVEYVFQQHPSETDIYFNYYATMVISHYGGQMWEAWNEQMREFLINTQARRGHEVGSWYFPDEHGDEGGRMYNTAMAIMILEVYYRYLPLYREASLDEDW